ncbi:MAG: SDR family oxidoreductase [Acidobacteriaceae bacterium]|nr:SDR family oxidoreductase [Acidobacteriaceae bacterium]
MIEQTLKPTLANKVALVTGGSRGIGAGIVRRLVSDGASVAFTYANSEPQANDLVAELQAFGGRAKAIQADSASATDIEKAVSITTEEFGGALDIFVSNAGKMLRKPITEVEVDELDEMIAVNIRAAMLGFKFAAKNMNRDGRIVAIGSASALRTGFPGSSIYSMTKSALLGLVRGAAIDLASRGITVNVVQPGPIATDMNAPDKTDIERLIKLVPLGRLGQDTEVASLVAYLARPEAAFITGSSLSVDGGLIA